MRSVYIAPNAGPISLMAINAHQVTAEKRLESHDEQLILIILVVGCYNMHRYCDRWLRRKPTWTAPY
jgi:hypothetical protein